MSAPGPSLFGGWPRRMVVVPACVLVGACSGATSGSNDNSVAPSPVPSTSGVTSEARSEEVSVGQQAARSATTSSDVDRDQLAAAARHDAKEFGIDVGATETVAPDEQFPLIAECLREYGFSSQIVWRGILFDPVPTEQSELAEAVKVACQDKYVLPPEASLEPTASQFALLYRHLVDVAVPCLEERGHQPVAPTAEADFVDRGRQAWDPFRGVGEADKLRCPPEPPWDEWVAAR